MKRGLAISLLAVSLAAGKCVFAQEGPLPTQMLVSVDSKSTPPANAAALTVAVDGRKEPVTSWEPLAPGKAQVALLIDDGLRESIGREFDTLQAFIGNLPLGVEVMIGFMQYGRVVAAQDFTTDHAAAAASLHLPQGTPDASASPYLCLSEFVKHWPGSGGSPQAVLTATPQRKARVVLMLTNGVDPYNGSTSMMNQNSPYVAAAISDAQRAGVQVDAIYYGDIGVRGPSADNSGQDYLSQLTESTGGEDYWQGYGNPVTLTPYLKQFQQSLAETYVATFSATAGHDPQHDMVQVKITAPHAKLRAPSQVLPGNRE